MIILAIDPGNVQSAYVFMNEHKKILMKGKVDNYQLLSLIQKNRSKITHCVCEMIAQYGMGVGASTFHTCVWIGEFKRIFSDQPAKHKNFYFLYRKTYVSYVCNDPRAKDGDIRTAMTDQYGEPGTKKHPGPTYGFTKDMWQALAIASYFVEMMNAGKFPVDIEQNMIDEYYNRIEERKEKAKCKNANKKSASTELSESQEEQSG